MSAFREKMKEEYVRIMRIRWAKQDLVDSLPKGSIQEKHRGDHVYYYLSYRSDGRVITKYIPPCEIEEYRYNVQLRKRLEREIKEADEDMKMIRRVVRV